MFSLRRRYDRIRWVSQDRMQRVCCHGRLAGQQRVSVPAALGLLEFSSSFPARALPALGSANSEIQRDIFQTPFLSEASLIRFSALSLLIYIQKTSHFKNLGFQLLLQNQII